MKNQLINLNLIYKMIIAVLLIALCITFYFGFMKEEEQPVLEEVQPVETVVSNPIAEVPTSELVTLDYCDDRLFYAYIEDGFLYYYNAAGYGQFVANSTPMAKYEDLSNITRMKVYNLGTGVNPVPFLITEEGKVYKIDHYIDKDMDTNIQVNLCEALVDYEVADILSHTGETYSRYELLLKDGTTQTVEIDYGY